MVYGDPLKSYQRANVETTNPLNLVIMCYDAAIKDVRAARELHAGRSMGGAYEKLRHAQDIVTELLVALDYEEGGDIANNLSRLYNFILRQLIGINSQQSLTVYDPVVEILEELKDAWEQIRRQGIQMPGAEAGPPAQGWSGVSA